MGLYQRYLVELIGGFQVIWLAAYRGQFGRKFWHTKIMNDWKIFDMIYPVGTDIDQVEAAKKFYKKAHETGTLGPQFMLSINSAGKTRALLLTDAISREEWREHWMGKIMEKHGVGERMVGAYTLSDTAESYFMIDRAPGEAPFGEKDRALLYDALVDFPRVHYWLFLNRGLVEPAKKPLSPREQSVLQYLLGPKSKAEIAECLGLTTGTVQNYIIDIYKIFDVSSRYELVQLWLDEVPRITSP
ncbi:helix-turn-helix transcriptional regulator [Hellea balneolensis]|uniref:helix-turn-helix transcriptional regulator n=1 Tax=Hellea balneolensis TaxID=287478 RepID=UPI000688D81B|nr:helix-turn-helix transcriptional regulator [Hellea balneolensis]